MAKFLRFIGLLVIALAVWQTATEAFAVKAVGEEGCLVPNGKEDNEEALAVSDEGVIAGVRSLASNGRNVVAQVQDDSSIGMPPLPYLPDAELADAGGQAHSPACSRAQRSSITNYIVSLKEWIGRLARREAALSLHREKLYDATAFHRCRPVCEYYIFTLRRILI